MKVFLLNPPPAKIVEKYDLAVDQHIGLGYLAGAVCKAGHEVMVLDAKLERQNVRQTLRIIKNDAPDILGVSAMTHQIDDAAAVVEQYKKKYPGIITVIGGVHVTALPEGTLAQYPCFDFGIAGEGEIALVKLINAFCSKDRNFSAIAGLVYREQDKINFNPVEVIADIDSLSPPSWQLFPRLEVYNMITSRGCPHTCVFCMRALGKTVRFRDLDLVIREIEGVIADIHPERIIFHDETFTKNKDRTYAFCRQLIARGINKKVKWKVATRVDAIDEALLKIMKEAGCDYIEFGIESGNAEMLKTIKKGITKSQARQAVKMAKDLGYFVGCGFILGHPHETLETALQTIDFAAELNPDLIQLGIMVPYPGTKIREMALRGDGGYTMLSSDWRQYNKQVGNALALSSLSRKDLERLQLIGYLRLFAHNKRIVDFIKFVFAFRLEMTSYLRNIFRMRQLRKGSTQISWIASLRYIVRR